MDLGFERQVALSVNQSVRELPPLRVRLEIIEFSGRVEGFAIKLVDGRGVQGFAEHLVRVFAQCDHQWVRGHNGLRIVGLLCGCLVRQSDGIVDVVDPSIVVKTDGVLSLQRCGQVCLLVQWRPTGREGVWRLVWIVRVAIVLYEWVLIWVPVPDTGGATPGSPRCRRTWRRCASRATFAAFLLYTAHANCSSLHCKLIFFSSCDCVFPHAGRDSQYSFSFPKLIIKFLDVGFVSRCGSHPTRV